MAEEGLETSEIQERLTEAMERLESSEEKSSPVWLMYMSLSTALIAVIAAVASLRSGAMSNDALLAKNEALLFQSHASDQWAFYQAKGIKALVTSNQAEFFALSNPALAEKLNAEVVRYKSEQQEIQSKAKEFEVKVNEHNEISFQMLEKHHNCAKAVTFFQVSIALGAIAALTRRKPLWFCGLACGVVGVAMFVMGFL